MLSHMGAGFGAAAAGGGADAAVFHIGMVFAFPGATAADTFTKLAKLFREFPAHAHDLGGRIAEGGAFQVELDAAGHALDVIFKQTGAGALLAKGGAGAAGLYTLLILLV
jgi:hypothetical protein